MIADPASELDPSRRADALFTPDPGSKSVKLLVTAVAPQWMESLLIDMNMADGKSVIDSNIGDQLADHGWTESDIQAVIKNGATGTSVGKRSAVKLPDGVAGSDLAPVCLEHQSPMLL